MPREILRAVWFSCQAKMQRALLQHIFISLVWGPLKLIVFFTLSCSPTMGSANNNIHEFLLAFHILIPSPCPLQPCVASCSYRIRTGDHVVRHVSSFELATVIPLRPEA